MKRKIFVYVGPSRPYGLPVSRNAVLAGEPEAVFPQLARLFNEHQSLRRLFVPVADLSAARAALGAPGSLLAQAAANVKNAQQA